MNTNHNTNKNNEPGDLLLLTGEEMISRELIVNNNKYIIEIYYKKSIEDGSNNGYAVFFDNQSGILKQTNKARHSALVLFKKIYFELMSMCKDIKLESVSFLGIGLRLNKVYEKMLNHYNIKYNFNKESNEFTIFAHK